MSFYAWIKHTSAYLLALALVATVAGVAVAGLAYGWAGLAAGLTAGMVLWLTPWQRLATAIVRWLAAWLFVPDAAPKRVGLAHERLPRRVRRRVPDHLLPYDRIKVRYGEHVAALLVFASGIGLLALAGVVYFFVGQGGEISRDDALFAAALTMMIGGPLLFALWRPDGRWVECEPESAPKMDMMDSGDEWFLDPAYASNPANIWHRNNDYLDLDRH